ncbi:MAG TPA: BON domain-containing protein [Rhizobacter sp.]|nr:BON domain-containing protein [Rhizobacter sp.]
MTRTTSRAMPFDRLRSVAVIGALVTATAALSGCAAVLVGGAVVGGTLLATDRRSSGAQIDDQSIELKANTRIREVLGDRGHVNVTSYNRIVLLTGEVPTEENKAAIEQGLGRLDNVRATVNELVVGTASSLSNRSNDALVTSKVKATLVDAGDISANAFKVVTERSIVYLMGRVTEREADRAVNLTRSIGGVQKVVRVMEVISEAELAEIDPNTAPKASTTGPRP